jgi:hypothetical protein
VCRNVGIEASYMEIFMVVFSRDGRGRTRIIGARPCDRLLTFMSRLK